ncbi:MAG: VWA domain-containing protein [Kangiellaceae bacterium]|nr:VWA domain-containing protein [Kangiellaceae bacterium]
MIDLVFVVDGSGSICDNDPSRKNDGSGCDNWKQIVNFITEFVTVMEPSETGTHVGLVSFSTESLLLAGLSRCVFAK